METVKNSSRREFIKLSAVTGAGLVLGVQLTACSKDSGNQAGVFQPNIWLAIDKQNKVTVVLSKAEMGQGVMTALSTLVAEELDVDMDSIKVELADASDKYGSMLTAGSTSIQELWLPLRTAGAAAREMLIKAASSQFDVAANECQTKHGAVIHQASGKSLKYSELLDAAAQQSVPQEPKLKNPNQFSLIGKQTNRIETQDKVTGKAKYGIDVELPGLKYAAIRQAPVFGARLQSVNSSNLSNDKSIHSVVELDNAVAVVADSYWRAQKALNSLDIKWSQEASDLNSVQIRNDYKTLASQAGTKEFERGIESGASVHNTLTSDYEAAFQAHATMEPMNCTVHIHDDGCDIWAPTQHPQGALDAAKEVLQTGVRKLVFKALEKVGVENNIKVHPTLIGGGFGRRLQQDFVVQAVEIAVQAGVPVKLIWSREEDIQHDFYRPYTYHRLEAKLGQNTILDWRHRIVGPTHGRSVGGSTHLPYDMEHIYIDYHKKKHGVPIGSWRSIGSSHNAFVTESFIDEISHALNQDPFSFRQKLMKEHQRSLRVLNEAAQMAGWGKSLSSNQGMGIAVHPGFGSFIAMVAQVSIHDGALKVEKVTAAVDCGLVVNPAIVKAQIEGGIVFGLTAALKDGITIEAGKVEQSNFHDFGLLSYEEMPEITVKIIDSQEDPGGIGEVGVPPIAPAVANAYFAVSGKRLKTIPFEI